MPTKASIAEEEARSELSLDDLPRDVGFFMNELLEEDRDRLPLAEAACAAQLRLQEDRKQGYNDRLRMPQFTFAVDPQQNQAKIEAGDDVRAGAGRRAAAGRVCRQAGSAARRRSSTAER